MSSTASGTGTAKKENIIFISEAHEKFSCDICKRNGKKVLIWFGDKQKTLNYQPKSDEMILTVQRWFANKSCPGDWMYARMGN